MNLGDNWLASRLGEWESRLKFVLYGALVFITLYGLFLSSSFFRLIWIDEFVNFAMGAATSFSDAWFIVVQTTPAINHGHTGIYLLLSYFGLSHFGANALVLRAPAMLSGALLMFFAVYFFRILRFSIVWQFLAVMALFGQSLIIYFIGEARTYMPLTASVVGLLVYYMGRAIGPNDRILRLIGIASAVLGVLMSPYIAVYWPAMVVVGYFYYLLENQQRPHLKTLLNFINIPLVMAGTASFFLIGTLTWMRGSPTFNYDSFQWIRQPSIWWNLIDYSHIQFISMHKIIATILTAIAVIGSIILTDCRAILRFLTPILLIFVTVLLSAILVYMSYRMNYWILPRQFVASSALIALGLIWLWAEATRLIAHRSIPAGIAVGLAAAFIVFGQVQKNHSAQWSRLRAEAEAQTRTNSSIACIPPSIMPQGLSLQESNDAWVAEANRNILCGGPIWPVFRTYYEARP